MKQVIFLLLFVFSLSFAAAELAAQEKGTFGPMKYDVKERYGKDNLYKENFKSTEGLFVVKIQNGNVPRERVEFIELKINNMTLLKDDRYDYGMIASIVKLQKENSLEVNLKDVVPPGFKRPLLPPRFVTISIVPYAGKLPVGSYAGNDWESITDTSSLLEKIRNQESASLAQSAINLSLDTPARGEAMRKLSDRRDLNAESFIARVFKDVMDKPEVRAEAGIALGILGNKGNISLLMDGVLDPEEIIRTASARALSFYKEEDTRQPLTDALVRLDAMRRGAVIASIVSSGWKPLGTMLTLAESEDAHISTTALELLKNNPDPRVTDLLLALFDKPGSRDIKAIISAMGETKDPRAIERLVAMTKDPGKRAGKEAELGEALANSGNPQFADLITAMIKKSESRQAQNRLREAYRKLTGKDYK
jgi:HEAT repeat protein